MTDGRIKRRRFLADILFAGGALSAAALLAQVSQAEPTPSPNPAPATQTPAATPKPSRTPEFQLDGDVALPPPKPKVAPEPTVRGRVVLPQRQVPNTKPTPPNPK